MTPILESVLLWAERQLPEDRRMWISELRSESKHIVGGFARQQFILSGIIAAMGQILRLNFGVQRVGQILLGVALITMCLGGIYMAPSIENDVVRTSFYGVLPVYAATAGLAFFNLKLMKRFAGFCIIALFAFWLISGLEVFTSMDAPVYFFRAFALETVMIMAGLFIAASYLGWAGEADHA